MLGSYDPSVVQAVSEKKLFVADYHDSYLPFVERINSQKDSKTYATRALFFLSANDQLKVLALELVLPPMAGKPKLSLVFTPPNDTSKDFIWQTARAHVANNDIVVHQVFSHWQVPTTVPSQPACYDFPSFSCLSPAGQTVVNLVHELKLNWFACNGFFLTNITSNLLPGPSAMLRPSRSSLLRIVSSASSTRSTT